MERAGEEGPLDVKSLVMNPQAAYYQSAMALSTKAL